MKIKLLILSAIAIFFAINMQARTGAPVVSNGFKPSSLSHNPVVPDQTVPGVVIVKLTRIGASQFAASKNFPALAAKQHAVYNFRHAGEAFPGHSIMRYATGKASPQILSSSIDDDISRILFVNYSSGADPKEVATALARNPYVEYAEPQYIRKEFYLPSNALYSQQWDMDTIHCPAAWDITMGDTNVIVAIVDDGVDTSHPDLQPNMWHNSGEEGLDANHHDKRTNGIDDENDGYIDDWQGWDFAGYTKGSPQTNDPSGGEHGIHVAGIVAAAGIPTGTIGVAPHCKLMAIKTSYLTDMESVVFGDQGITYAADHGARVINCSWGGSSFSSSEQDVINYATAKGALVVAAAGNNNEANPEYPGYYNHVLCVTASMTGNMPDPIYADWGPRVDVIAPGSDILSTWNNNITPGPGMGADSASSYTTLSGTSMATPHAAGVAALVASHFPNYTPDQIAARVRNTCNSIDSSLYFTFQKNFGYGIIDAYRAVHDSNVEAVVIDSFYVSNDNNGDGMLEPGETGSLRVRFKDLLSPTTHLSATIVPMDTVAAGNPSIFNPYVTISNPTDYIGALKTFDTITTPSNTFRVTVSPNIPQNFKLSFRVYFTDGAYSDYRYFTMTLNPTYVTMDANDIGCTFNSRGNFAFNDFPTNTEGVGFTYKGSDNLLYEGSLMIGTDSEHIVNVARDASSGLQDSDFIMTQRAQLKLDADGTQEATATWNDNGAVPANKLGIQVSMHNFEYTTPGNTNVVLITYDVKNTSQSTLRNLFCGMYMDWDIGTNGDSNYCTYDDPYGIGWIQRLSPQAFPVVGSTLLSAQLPNFYALENDPDSCVGPYVNNGYTRAQKYFTLSSAIGRHNSCVGDVSDVMSGGPVSLFPGQDTVFAFALLGGQNLSELEQGTIAARQLWKNVSAGLAPQEFIFFTPTNIYGVRDTTLVDAIVNKSDSSEQLSLSLAGQNPSSFAIITQTNPQISANGAQNVSVKFIPTDTGLQTANLVIKNNSTGAQSSIAIYGTGLPLGISMSPTPLSFDSVTQGQAESQTVVITSTRSDTMYGTVTVSGKDSSEFSVPSNVPSPVEILPGKTTFPVDFAPTRNGAASALLTLALTVGTDLNLPLSGTSPTGVFEPAMLPSSMLVRNYPNPFSASTIISYSGADVVRSIVVFDMLGREVADLTSQLRWRNGAQQASFDAANLPDGMYIYEVRLSGMVLTGQMTVLK